MKIPLLITAILVALVGPKSAVACSQPSPADIMNMIEQRVRMPSGAFALNQYARFYAESSRPGSVVGVYVRYVDRANKIYTERRGRRIWLNTYRDLPVVKDGGCSVVTIIFEPATKRMVSVRCNGEA